MGDHLAISRGRFTGALNPLKTDLSRGRPGISGGPGPLGPHHNPTTSGSASISINDVARHWARLVVGWVTVFGPVNRRYMCITSHNSAWSSLRAFNTGDGYGQRYGRNRRVLQSSTGPATRTCGIYRRGCLKRCPSQLALVLWHTVRKNVYNNSKKRKKSCFFWILKKNVKKTYI